MSVQNIVFQGNDIQYLSNIASISSNPSLCYNSLKIQCCQESDRLSGNQTNPCNLQNQNIFTQESKSLGLFNLEMVIDNSLNIVPQFFMSNCQFVSMQVLPQQLIIYASGFLQLIKVLQFPSSLSLKNTSITGSFLSNGIVMNDQATLLNDPLYYQNSTYFSGLVAQIQSSQNAQSLTLQLNDFNIASYNNYNVKETSSSIIGNFIRLSNISATFTINLTVNKGVASQQGTYLVSLQNILQKSLLSLQLMNVGQIQALSSNNSNIQISSLLLQNLTLQDYQPYFNLMESNVTISNALFYNLSKTSETSPFIFSSSLTNITIYNSSFVNTVSIYLLLQGQSTLNFTLVTLSNVSYINYFVNSANSNIYIGNSSFLNINGSLNSGVMINLLDQLFQRNLIAEFCSFVQISGVYVFGINNINQHIYRNCTFSAINPIQSPWSTDMCYVLLLMQGCSFSNSVMKVFQQDLGKNFTITHILQDTVLQNLTITNYNNINYMFYSIQVNFSIINNQWFNITLALGVRSAIIVHPNAIILIANSTFVGVGHNQDSSKVLAIYDQSFLVAYQINSLKIYNSIFVSTPWISQRAGFVYAYYMQFDVEIINCTFTNIGKTPGFRYGGVVLITPNSTKILNSVFSNLDCTIGISIWQNNGILGIMNGGSFGYLFDNHTVNLTNNTFSNCTCASGGAFSIGSYQNVFVKDIFVYNTTANIYGGAFQIQYAQNLTLVDITSNASYSFSDAGLGYIGNVILLNMSNCSFSNSFGILSGGLYITNVGNMTISNIQFQNTSSADISGALYIENSFVFLSNTTFTNCKAINYGGAVYLTSQTTIKAQGIIFYNGQSGQGGAIYVDAVSKFILFDSLFQNCSAMSNGGSIYIGDVSLNTIFRNITLKNCSSIAGTIYVQSYIQSNYNLQEISCLQNKANIGSCIYIQTVSDIIITNLEANNSQGNQISVQAYRNILFNMSNVYIYNCLTNSDIININGLQSYISNVSFINNTLGTYDFVIQNSQVVGNLIVYQHNLVPNYLQFMSYGILIQTSSVTFNSISFTSLLFGNTIVEAIPKINQIIGQNCQLTLSNFTSQNKTQNITSKIRGLMYFTDSSLTLINVHYINNDALNFELVDSNLTMSQCSFMNNLPLYALSYPSGFLSTNQQTLANFVYVINSSFFSTNGAIFMMNNLHDLQFINCSFVQPYPVILSQVLISVDIINLVISNCSFSGYSSTQGSIVQATQLHIYQITIALSGSNISNSQAQIGGAFSLTGYIKMDILNCNFINNSAVNAGVVYSNCLNDALCQINITNSNFTNNYASQYAPTVLAYAKVLSQNNVFTANTDGFNYSQGLAFQKAKNMMIFNSSNSLIIASGQSFNLKLGIYDQDNNLLVYDNTTTAQLVPTLEGPYAINIQNYVSKAVNGVFAFQSIVKTQPNTSFTLNITFSQLLLEDTPYQFYTLQNASVRSCIKGEILLQDYTCFVCLLDSFSIVDPSLLQIGGQQCINCPYNTFCSGGSIATPIQGFWKIYEESLFAIQCEPIESCLGNADSNLTSKELVQGKCAVGHYGNLCNNCITGYGKSDDDEQCISCSDQRAWIWSRLAVLVVLIIGYLGYNIYIFTRDLVNNQGFQVAYIKILINYQHILGFIIYRGVKFTYFDLNLEWFSIIQQQLSISSANVFSNQCWIEGLTSGNPNNRYPIQVIITLLLPLLISTIFISVYTGVVCFKHLFDLQNIKAINWSEEQKQLDKLRQKVEFVRKILLAFSIAMFIFYPLVLRSCFNFFNCISFDPNSQDTYLLASTDIQCWNYFHKYTTLAIGVPGIILWGVAYPSILIFSLMYFQRKRGRQEEFDNLYILKEEDIKEERMQELKNLEQQSFVKIPLADSNNSINMNEDVSNKPLDAQLDPEGAILPITDLFVNLKTTSFLTALKMDISENIMRQGESNPSKGKDSYNMPDSSKMANQQQLQTRQEQNPILFWNQQQIARIDQKRMIVEIINSGHALAFFMRVYKVKHYYWEGFIFAYKFLMTLLASLDNFLTTNLKCILQLSLSVSYLYLVVKYRPYLLLTVNRLEQLACSVIIICLCCIIIMNNSKIYTIQVTATTILMVSNLLFICIFLQSFAQNLYRQWKKYMQQRAANKTNKTKQQLKKTKKVTDQKAFKSFTQNIQGFFTRKKTSI